ncbi:selenium metabolism-associated LysR family transcriptional regulator [Thalassobacillus pellis]|uniref:selenium metabolism-associated LysR family transcriptional regulator n=1 Tax=Thalassobacillus pellis TaxID=748008 RepID=UPI0019616F26|nr:selenium metabolism-associated LysR family transcriptional regulator [Thalassobacillus pellis]MBM7554472.1 DNA-binding transcriptional LysR family regulator [Thalassobacillus pellis]
MNLEHLKTFHTAALKKNFSETAKALHLSQPSVSLQIRQLEEYLGAPLFKRTTQKVYLTPAGDLFLKTAEKILKEINETKKDIQKISHSTHGNLIIGASLTIGEHILPYLFASFKAKHPHINFILKLYNSQQIIEKLSDEEIHLGFIESMISYPDFVQKAFLEDELVIISSYENVEIPDDNGYISTEQLMALPFILRERGSGTRQVIEEKLSQNHLNPSKLNVIMELENTESIKSAVEAGLGISIISKAAVQKEIHLKTLKPLMIRGINLKRSLFTIYKDYNLSLPGEVFQSFVLDFYQCKKTDSL